MPGKIRNNLVKAGINSHDADILLVADVATVGFGYIKVLLGLVDNPKVAKYAANWMIHRDMTDAAKQLEQEGMTLGPVWHKLPSARQFADVYEMQNVEDILSSNNADTLLSLIKTESENRRPRDIAEQEGLLQVSDETELEKLMTEVLKENPQVVSDVKAGEHKAIGFLVGQVMKKSDGKANPGLTQKIIRRQFGI